MLHDDAFLIKELQKGNEQAFKALYEKYWEHLYAVACYWTGSREDAREIVQDVFVGLWEKRSSLSIHNSFSSYVFAITKYKVFDWIDAKVIRKNYFAKIQKTSTVSEPYTENALMLKETQQRISDALANLPKKTQQIFFLGRKRSAGALLEFVYKGARNN